MQIESIFGSRPFKKLVLIGFSMMLIGCGAGEREVNQKSKQKNRSVNNETNVETYLQNFKTIKDDSNLYLDFEVGSDGASVHAYEAYDMKIDSWGVISLSDNVKLYRTKEIKYPVTAAELFEIRAQDSTLNSEEFISFNEGTSIEEITDLDELNKIRGQNSKSWVVYYMPEHELLTRLVVYVIKTDNENYFAIQPTRFDASSMPPTLFSLNMRVKKINNPINIMP